MKLTVKILALCMFLLLLVSATEQITRDQVITYELSGLIEIDGNVFLNDTCKAKIIAIIDLNNVTITDSTNYYQYEHCNHYKCNVIHLTKISRYEAILNKIR